MVLKQVKEEAFEVVLVLVYAKQCTGYALVAKQENGLKTSQRGSF